MLVGEALALGTGDAVISHARQQGGAAVLDADLPALAGALDRVRRELGQEPALAELLTALPEALGQGHAFSLLFDHLFPGVRSEPVLTGNGKRVLTRAQVGVLRELCLGLPHEEVAERLRISPRTLHTHLRNIYQRLDARSPLQAIARATAMGYLELDELRFIRRNANCHIRDYRRLETFCAVLPETLPPPLPPELATLAQCGLLLLTAAVAARRALPAIFAPAEEQAGLICEVDAAGAVRRRFTAPGLGTVRGLAVAPAASAAAGFTPGRLFAIHDRAPQHGLNRAAISEFTAEGQLVRTFCGGRDLATRLVGPVSIAFAADGALLATSGWLTDGILAFRDGGATVRRFADGLCIQVCTGRSGSVFATQHTNAGSVIRVMDAAGQLRGTVSSPEPNVWFYGIAAGARGHLFVTRQIDPQRVIEEYDRQGRLVRSFPIPGFNHGLLTSDSRGRVYVPCPSTRRVTVLDPREGTDERWDLAGVLEPIAVAVTPRGRAWVGGCEAAPADAGAASERRV